MQFNIIIAAATAVFASTAAAQPVEPSANSAVANIVATKGFGNGQTRTPVKIPFGKLTHKHLSITGLELESVTVHVPGTTAPKASQVTCQMYKDEYGVQPGSTQFTKGHPAAISTNAVDFGWVLCYVNVDSD